MIAPVRAIINTEKMIIFKHRKVQKKQYLILKKHELLSPNLPSLIYLHLFAALKWIFPAHAAKNSETQKNSFSGSRKPIEDNTLADAVLKSYTHAPGKETRRNTHSYAASEEWVRRTGVFTHFTYMLRHDEKMEKKYVRLLGWKVQNTSSTLKIS